jgi:hypothetical protein
MKAPVVLRVDQKDLIVLLVDLEDLVVLVAAQDRNISVIVVDLDDHVVPSGDPEDHGNSVGAVRAEVLAVVPVC